MTVDFARVRLRFREAPQSSPCDRLATLLSVTSSSSHYHRSTDHEGDSGGDPGSDQHDGAPAVASTRLHRPRRRVGGRIVHTERKRLAVARLPNARTRVPRLSLSARFGERHRASRTRLMNHHEPDREGMYMGSELLTHLDAHGRAQMVDVGEKPETQRVAIARAIVRMAPETAAAVVAGDAPKGDVIGTARLAAIQAAKRTDEWIPLAHSLSLSSVDVDIDIDAGAGEVSVTTTARVFARTGVEMEAMVGCAAGALCVYDMVKGMERGVVLERLELLEKRGGRSGTWRRYEQD